MAAGGSRRGEPMSRSSSGRLRVLDLFAGCGGFSLGFHAVGFEVAGALELDPDAAATHASNFACDLPPELHAEHARARDITRIGPGQLCAQLQLDVGSRPIDVIVGGPPCQAFARVGRAKLRTVSSSPDAHLLDPRADLYQQYLTYVEHLRPKAVVLENVPEFLSFGGANLAEVMCEVLDDLGYECAYTLLNAVNYGVPQLRERVFLIAVSRDVGAAPRFPLPTHWYPVPAGYRTTRSHTTRVNHPDLFQARQPALVPSPAAHRSLPKAVTTREALGDLPRLDRHLDEETRSRLAGSAEPDYSTSAYAAMMQKWPGFEGKEVENHVTRRLPRDYRIFERMKAGDQYPEAWRIANELFQEALRARHTAGAPVEEGSPEYLDLRRRFVPPYDPEKFENKWRKMEPDAPARTLMAHLGRDCYTHIHYDSTQARTISVREAARLQSFPDGFRFPKSMNAAFRMIGNAVPPLLSMSIAREILSILDESASASRV